MGDPLRKRARPDSARPKNFKSPLCKPIIDFAGKDVSHWFNPATKEPKTRISSKTGYREYYCPNGRFLHVTSNTPSNVSEPQYEEKPWWRDESLIIGKCTEKSTKIQIINMLTHQRDIIEVPVEETINEILQRYKMINDHAGSYIWKSMT